MAVLMNDLHISKDNIQEFNKNWNEALGLCRKIKVKDLVIGGDVFTSRSSQSLSVLLAVQDAFVMASDMGIHITVTNGNHDKVNPKDFRGYCNVFGTIKNVNVVDKYTALKWDGCDYVLIPVSYFPETDGDLDWLLTSIKDDESLSGVPENKMILYLHEGIHGALGNFDIPGELPQDAFKDYKSVLVGHYHNRVKIKGTNIEYIGASRQHNFGEDEEKGYTILYSDGSTEFVKNEVNIRYKVINVDMDELGGIDRMLPDLASYKVNLRVNCKSEEASGAWKQKFVEMGIKVDAVSENIKISDIEHSGIEQRFDKEGIKREYVSFCEKRDVESDLGLKYLNKII